MRTLPIGLDVNQRSALVVGTSAEVISKIDRLLDAGARVTVIAADDPGEAITARAAAGRITLLRREVEDADLEGHAIVFVAPFTTPAQEVRARRWHAEATRAGRLLSVIDRPEASTCVSFAIARTPGLTLTIGTEGVSPGLARRVREDLEALFADPRFSRFVASLAALRQRLPRGERAARMAAAVEGFAIEASLRFPAWLHDKDDP